MISKKWLLGVYIFIVGVVLNEFFLMIQGVASLYYIATPYINEALFVTSLVLFTGASWIFFVSKSRNTIKADLDHTFPLSRGRTL